MAIRQPNKFEFSGEVDSWAESVVDFIENDLGLDPEEAVNALIRAVGDYARNSEGVEEGEFLLNQAADLLADEEL